jgi:hypothetical protein
MEMGLIDRNYARGLMELPDVEDDYSLEDAEMEDIKNCAYRMLYKGETIAPEPIQSLPLAVKYMRSYYLRAKLDNAPMERLDLLLDWIARADMMVQTAAQANQMAQAAAQSQAAPTQQPPSAALPTG